MLQWSRCFDSNAKIRLAGQRLGVEIFWHNRQGSCTTNYHKGLFSVKFYYHGALGNYLSAVSGTGKYGKMSTNVANPDVPQIPPHVECCSVSGSTRQLAGA